MKIEPLFLNCYGILISRIMQAYHPLLIMGVGIVVMQQELYN